MSVRWPRGQASEDPLAQVHLQTPAAPALPPSNYLPSNYPKPTLNSSLAPSLCLWLLPGPTLGPD